MFEYGNVSHKYVCMYICRDVDVGFDECRYRCRYRYRHRYDEVGIGKGIGINRDVDKDADIDTDTDIDIEIHVDVDVDVDICGHRFTDYVLQMDWLRRKSVAAAQGFV